MGLFSLPALLVGLFVTRWCAILLTIGAYVVFSLAFPHLYSESYSNSSDFDSAASYSIVLLGILALPAAAAASLGVAMRIFVRWIVFERPTPPPLRNWTLFLDWPFRWLEGERRIARDGTLKGANQPMTGSARRSGRGR